jgi:hypothetical protein
MKRLLLLFLLVGSMAHAETCELKTYASSWMATGTEFKVACPSGDYHGVLVSTPARRFFRRGHLMLKFDQPLVVLGKKPGDEGRIQIGHGRQLVTMMMVGSSGIGAKDLTDGLAGAVYKSWYAIPITVVGLSFFSNGGDVNLKPGFKLEVVPAR